MTAKLISKTVPEAFLGINSDQLVAYIARVSHPENQDKHETGWKLLRSLIRRREWSPFDMVDATLEIVTTRDVARQLIRHRSFYFQEFSQRYAEVKDFAPPRDARAPHPTDRQLSVPVADPSLSTWWRDRQNAVIAEARDAYRKAIDFGIAREVARAVLPEGLTISRLYMKGSLRSWYHYVDLRYRRGGAQTEHEALAGEINAVLSIHFPMLFTEVEQGV